MEIDENNPAVKGFARSCGIAVGDLEIRDGRLLGEAQTGGKALAEYIPEILPSMLTAITISRRMRWGDGKHRFARPVHWLCVLHGDEVIPCELFGIKSGHVTYGHRHHCPQPLTLNRADDYEETLKEEGRVIVDFDERREEIETPVGPTESALLNEAAATTEWPQVLDADFDPAFLALPSEVIVQTLEHALKVFPRRDEQGQLLPKFAIVADVESSNPQTIVRGYENVVRARLEDAKFFFEQDQKTSLEKRRAILKRTLFQEKLGTLADKATRLEKLAAFLAPYCGASPEHTQRAAQLCKCDLDTDLVGEYPALQGIMGGYYAAAAGENEKVADAIRDQYARGLHGDYDTPHTPEGVALALADRVDTLVGFHLVDLTPSGSKDPFALGSTAMSILYILAKREVDLDLGALLDEALLGYQNDFDELKRQAAHQGLVDYLYSQMNGTNFVPLVRSLPVRRDVIAAVGKAIPKTMCPWDFIRRFDALCEFIQIYDADSLIAANKRIRNILAKTDGADAAPDADAMTAGAEINLFSAVEVRRATFDRQFGGGDYLGAMETLARLRVPVDRFFDEVLVMSENEKERDNRLALLNNIRAMFLKIADFSELNLNQPEATK